jgi:hypothetical protein
VTLPNGDRAVIPVAKLTRYLLSERHPVGRHKARFLRALGFSAAEPGALQRELLRLARQGAVSGTEDNPYGRKYLVPGTLAGPTGSATVTTVWFVANGTDTPSLVTVLPRS